jgi:hypothetical protein
MPCNIEVQDATPVMADDEKAVEHVERESRDREEIHSGYRFAMIAQKSQPTLGRLRTPRRSPHPAGYGGFRHVETEHQEFAMDARRAPSWILGDHPEDQLTDLLGDPPATTYSFSHFAKHGPIQSESSLVPPDDGFGLDEKESLPPSRPEAARHPPEQLIERTQPRLRMLALQYHELLSEGEVLQQQAATTAKSTKDCSEPQLKQVKHGSKVIADGLFGLGPKLLISTWDRIVTRDKSQSLTVALA